MSHTFRIVSVVVGGLISIAVADASAQDWGRPPLPQSGACFYENRNFGGRYFCARVGSMTEVPESANDRISSIRVFGNAEVTVYRDAGFRGKSTVFDSDQRDLRQAGFNDRITSLRIGGSRYSQGGNRAGGWGRPPVPDRGGVCFYKSRNFAGDYFCSRVGDSTSLVPDGANDKISSIRIFGNAEVTVYRDIRFQGDSRVFTSDMSDLRRAGWNDLISSYRVDSSRGQGGNGPSRGRNGAQSGGRGFSYQEASAIVRRAYLSVLGREPDAAGSQGFVNALMNDSWTEQQVIAELRNSQEYRDRQRGR